MGLHRGVEGGDPGGGGGELVPEAGDFGVEGGEALPHGRGELGEEVDLMLESFLHFRGHGAVVAVAVARYC